MKIEDFGFITSVRKFEENSLLVKVLSKENGLISGYITHVKKDKNNYQIGNLVKFTWSAKNTNQLGILKIEIVKSYLSIFITSKFNLYLIENMNILINNLLYERFLEDKLYKKVEKIFNSILENKDKFTIIKDYLIFENTLLNIIGTGIIFEQDTILSNLYYISPKTGLAVSKEKGEPYKDKLLLFPSIFKKKDITKTDIFECFSIMDFFLKKYLNENNFINKYRIITISKENLLNNLEN